MKDPIELLIIQVFRFLELNTIADKWEKESPKWAKITSKVSKLLTMVSSFTAISDVFMNYLPENYKEVLFSIAAVNTVITFYANQTVKE
jgi:hypothetical protein